MAGSLTFNQGMSIMTINLIPKTLLLASLSISLSNNVAYANNNNLIEIIVKIYQAASSMSQARSEAKTTPTEPATIAPENFSKEASNTIVKAPNSTVAPSNPTASSNEPRDLYLEGIEKDKRDYERMIKHAAEVAAMNERAEADKIAEDKLYVEEFNKRNLTNKEFQKIYQNSFYRRNNVSVSTLTDKEKISIEKSLQFQEEQKKSQIAIHNAFQKHVKNVVKDMSLSFQELKAILVKGETSTQTKFDLNAAGDAITLKNIWAGVTNYEISHPELNTNCLYGLGGKDKYISDCDKVLAIIVNEYKHSHSHVSHTITKADLKKIAYALNPHETLD